MLLTFHAYHTSLQALDSEQIFKFRTSWMKLLKLIPLYLSRFMTSNLPPFFERTFPGWPDMQIILCTKNCHTKNCLWWYHLFPVLLSLAKVWLRFCRKILILFFLLWFYFCNLVLQLVHDKYVILLYKQCYIAEKLERIMCLYIDKITMTVEPSGIFDLFESFCWLSENQGYSNAKHSYW